MVRSRPPKFRTGYPDAMLLTVVSIRSVPVYLVYKYACRIMACTVFIALYDILEYLSFIVWLKLYLLKSCVAFLVYADIILCAELDRCFSFASYYRTDVWLMDAYNPVLNGVYLVVKHILLLFVQFHYREIIVNKLRCRCVSSGHVIFKIPEISVETFEKLSYECTDFLCRPSAHLRNGKVFLPHCPAVCTRLIPRVILLIVYLLCL